MEEIYEKYARLIYSFLLARCHNEHLAEELMQETFLRAYQSLERYNGNCKLSVWLCQIAKHIWYQYIEKHKYEERYDVNYMLEISNEQIEESLLRKYELLEVLKALHKLPEEMREVMYLRMISEGTFKEIGEILGHSENWARVTYFRGKERIMRRLRDNE